MPSLITKRGKKRYRATVMVQGIRDDKLFPDATKKSLKDALAWEEKREAEIRKMIEIGMGSLTVETWIDDYLDEAKASFAQKTYDEKCAVFKRFVKDTKINEFTPITEITKPICKAYLKKQNKTRGGNAANKDRKNLAAAWNWGQDNYEDDWPEFANPFQAIKKFPEKRHPRYVPSEDDFWKVYATSEGQDRVMLLSLLHLAARKGEIFRLKKSDLDFSNSRARLWTRKRENGTWEYDWLPMTTELAAALKWWIKIRMTQTGTDTEHIFVCLSDLDANKDDYGKPFIMRRTFMARMCKKVGVKYFDYHAIRHLSASVLYKAGYSLGHIQLVLRHKSPTTTERYLKRLGLEMVRDALETGLQIPAKIVSFKRPEDINSEQQKTPENGIS